MRTEEKDGYSYLYFDDGRKSRNDGLLLFNNDKGRHYLVLNSRVKAEISHIEPCLAAVRICSFTGTVELVMNDRQGIAVSKGKTRKIANREFADFLSRQFGLGPGCRHHITVSENLSKNTVAAVYRLGKAQGKDINQPKTER